MTKPPSDFQRLLRHLFGSQCDQLRVFAGDRVAGVKDLASLSSMYYVYPTEVDAAEQWLIKQSAANDQREVYFSPLLYTDRPKPKANRKADDPTLKDLAAPMRACYVDGDGAKVPPHVPKPTATVESSPGREHYYWALNRPVEPTIAEDLNRRLAYALDADKSGADLAQLLRVPGLPNRKYPDAPRTRLVEITDHRYDPDELLALLPEAPTAQRSSARGRAPHLPTSDTPADEPPVVLSQAAAAVWRGEHPKRHPDGSIERSGSLVKIGRAIYDAGATRATIVQTLAERDTTLGYNKYSERPDADERYHGIVDLLEIKGRTCDSTAVLEEFEVDEEPADAEEASDELIVLRRRYDQLQLTVKTYQRREAQIIAVLGNAHISTSERIVGITLALGVARAKARGRTDERGAAKIFMPKIAEASGLSLNATRAALKKLHAAGYCERDVRAEPAAADKSRTVMRVTVSIPGENERDILQPLINLHNPDRVKAGGARIRCFEHPDAAIVRRATYICTECGGVILETERELPANHPDVEAKAHGGQCLQDEDIGDTPTADAAPGDDAVQSPQVGDISTCSQSSQLGDIGNTEPCGRYGVCLVHEWPIPVGGTCLSCARTREAASWGALFTPAKEGTL